MPSNAAKSYIDAVMARADGATEGPFEPEYDADEKVFLVKSPDDSIVAEVYDCYGFQGCVDKGTARSNAHFIAASRQDIPTLAKIARRAIKTLEGVAISQCDCESDGRMIRAVAAKALADINALAAKGSQ